MADNDVSRYGRRVGAYPGSVDEIARDSNQEFFEKDDPLTTVSLRDDLNFRLGEDSDLRIYPNLHWNDLRAPVTAINPPGAASDPDFNITEVGYDFDDGSTETLFITMQMDHSYKTGTSVRPHVHWKQDGSGNVLWRLEYKWFPNGGAIPASFTSVDKDGDVFTYVSGSILQLSYFPLIVPSGDFNVSSTFAIKLSRIGGDAADTYVGDALLYEFDIHFQFDYLGSKEEFSK